MYQPPRTSSRAPASAANSPRTNPLRSNNDREDMNERRRTSYDPAGSIHRAGDSSSDLSGSQGLDDRLAEQAKEAQKLNQIVQQFFIKGALTIVGSRAVLPQAMTKTGTVRQNKWFNLCLDDSDELQGYLMDWRQSKLEEKRPPPLIIEIFVDLEELTKSQSLVIIDDEGKRWDVAEALDVAIPSNARPPGRIERPTQVMLERWEIKLDDFGSREHPESETLANIYKKCVPVFRSLYYLARALPAWALYRRISKQPASSPALKPRYRILNGSFKSPRKDTLDLALYPNDSEVVQRHEFGTLHSPAGPLHMAVTYRRNCDMRIDDAESLLSSHFMAMDDRYFRPSLADRVQEGGGVPSSVPTSRRDFLQDDREQGQAYGSLSTFHQVAPVPGTSPMSALRAVRDVGSSSPPANTPPQKIPPTHRSAQGARSSLRTTEAPPSYPRRTSVSFQPFKAGSLASSPASGLQVPPSPSSSLGRVSNLGPLGQARNRNSLTNQTLPQAALRAPALPNETAIASSASSSPKPAPINRYSSSFGHRRSRFSSGGGSKGEEDNNSSGKASASSSARQGSDVLNDPQGGSAGSMPQTDDDNLRDFISLLEQKKDLKSFNRRDSASRDATTRKTTAALSKYQRMRESNAALSDSLSSSLLLHRSSSSSSRQLSAVPPMIPGTSVSTSSSPGNQISPHTPHTPHTPAIPSRLSANSVANYSEVHRSRSRGTRRNVPESREEAGSDTTTRDTGPGPINIPTSPRPWPYVRRSSSVSQQNRILGDDEPEIFGLRSASSPGADARPELTMSELLRIREGGAVGIGPSGRVPGGTQRPEDEDVAGQPAYPLRNLSRPESRGDSSTPSSAAEPSGAFSLRSRLSRGNSRRGSPSLGPTAPVAESRRYMSSFGGIRGGQAQAQPDDDEPFIFTMSELGNASRRSLEEGRGGGSSGRPRGGSSWR